MKLEEMAKLAERLLGRIDPRLLAFAYRQAKRVPAIRDLLDREYDGVLSELRQELKPYAERFHRYQRMPAEGRSRASILEDMRALSAREESRWRDGYVSGAVYHGDEQHIEFLNEVYALNSQVNPLHSDLWPSATKYEAEIVSMTAHMLGADAAPAERPGQICGAVSSGGTESILLAMKAYRDQARERRGVRSPELVVPTTAHAAFEKAAQYFGMKLVRVPVRDDCRADVAATARALNRNTVAVVASTPSFPHGVIDPVEELSELARRRGIGCHVDACLGGFVLPWAERLGRPVPPFDFRLPGVTSMSADTHKYGYAAKGTSVVLYRGLELRRYQFYKTTDWPGGLYFSPTFAGSRPGALSAACWATMLSVGESGYLAATERILAAADVIRAGIESIPELDVLGDPLWVIAFGSEVVDIYRVLDRMTRRGWSLNGLHKPSCVHICTTLRHTQPGVAARFVADLRDAVAAEKANPAQEGGLAPVYGMAATLPVRGLVGDILERYLELLYEI